VEERNRPASRLLVIDRQQRVLLLQYEDEREEWWATSGGGAEETESFEEAAVREAREELGFDPRSIEPLWCGFIEFVSRGIRYRQTEQFFLIRANEHEVVAGSEVQKAHATEGIIAARWWSLEELRATNRLVFPEDLAGRIDSMNLPLADSSCVTP
jgi:ADP-ribose pyrophosphatase YjhB (NUDIX family)